MVRQRCNDMKDIGGPQLLPCEGRAVAGSKECAEYRKCLRRSGKMCTCQKVEEAQGEASERPTILTNPTAKDEVLQFPTCEK